MAHEDMNIDTDEGIDDETNQSTVPAGEVDEVQLLRRIKSWARQDGEHQAKWAKDADKDFAFVACEQFTEEDKKALLNSGRQPIVFNRCLTVVKSIAGSEINGRLDTRFLPRGVEDSKVNELLSAASEWMSDQCDAEDEQSEAFESALICGMGWTEARFTFDDNPQGEYVETEIDPREMIWDCKARKKNLSDSRRRGRVREIAITDARAMFPGVPDEDLDANWYSFGHHSTDDEGEPRPVEDKLHQNDDLDDPVHAEKTDVRIIQYEWWEKEPYYMVAVQAPAPVQELPMQGLPGMPAPQPQIEEMELTVDQFKEFQQVADEEGLVYESAKMTRKKFKRAFVGRKILEVGDAPFPDGFSFNCITGERDRKNNHFFGIVRVMRDPQMWANKMLINALHIANTTAKGGIIAELDAFEDEREAEETYAQPNHITWATERAVSEGKIMAKPGSGDVSVYIKILEFAISSIRDVTGVNLELLGLRDANQPGVLEAQRKQAAMTVLASLFNALRRFRKDVGRFRLHVIQTYLSDGRLIRIKGEHGGKVEPLDRERTLGDYDVIVADAPVSPNQKQETWQLIIQILPVVKEYLTPEVMLALLEYSPFPVEIVEKMREIKAATEEAAQQGQQEEMQRQKQLFDAQVAKIMSEVAKNQGQAQKSMADAQSPGEDPMIKQIMAQADAEKAMAEAQKLAAEAEATRTKSRTDAMSNLTDNQRKADQQEVEAHLAYQKHLADQDAAMRKQDSDDAMQAMTMEKMRAEIQKIVMETMVAMRSQEQAEAVSAGELALKKKMMEKPREPSKPQ